MNGVYTDKIFEFSKVLGSSNEFVGNIQIIQVGETCLDRGACVEEHVQTCNEITCIISGRGILISDDQEKMCNVGDIQIISKGRRHCLMASGDTSLRYIHFAFRFRDYEPKVLIDFYEQCNNVILHDDGEIRGILNMIVDEYFNCALFTDIVRCNLINLLLVVLWRKMNNVTGRYQPIMLNESISSVVYDITKYIEKHISDTLTVSGIAETFSYSSNYISKLFKAKMGVSLKEYIVTARMNYAETMLKEGKSSITEIAKMAGYHSVQAFGKAFKKYSGKPPGDIRK